MNKLLYLYSNKKERTTDTHNNMDESRKHYAKRKKPDSEEYILNDSIYMIFGKEKNYETQI